MEPPPRTRTSTRALLGGVFVAGWIGVSLGWVGRGEIQGGDLSSSSASKELRFYDRYNLRDGDYWQDYTYLKDADAQLIATEEWTTASVDGLSCSEGCTWTVTDPSGNETITTSTEDEATLAFKFENAGSGKVSLVYDVKKDGKKTPRTVHKAVASRFMRREVRELFEDDRESFFDALRVVYSTPTPDGQPKYGRSYHGAEYFLEYHTWMAGERACDHLHDGMGFITGHNAITLDFEMNLRRVNPRVSVPYWDYSIDMHRAMVSGKDLRRFYDSKLWTDDWFGRMGSSARENFAVTSGWVGDISVDPAFWKMEPSSVRTTNAYGLLRSPWNVAKDVRLLRCNTTFGYAMEYEAGPRCSEFYKVYSTCMRARR